MGRTNQPQSSQSAGLSLGLHTCQVCGDTAVALGSRAASLDCHGEPMVATEEGDRQVSRTALGAQLQEAFDIPRSGTDICYALLTDGLPSVAGIADRTGYERRTVETHLERLESRDLLASSTLPCEDGSDVTAYHTARETLPTTLLAFCLWATWAGGESVGTVDLATAEHEPSAVFRLVLRDADERSVRC
jgi:hypothetical protein